MKNVLIFITPRKDFKKDYRREMEFLVKVQIENSLAWGWKREDIMMVTNFDYEYDGVKTIVVPDETFSQSKRTVSKINAILALFDMGLITNELYWFHDFDAFQNAPIGVLDLGDKELALTHTSVQDERLSTGVMFFTKKSRNIFAEIQKTCRRYHTNEELAFRVMLRKDKQGTLDRLLILNISHNFAIKKRRVADQYLVADKPIKVLHFHPFDKRSCTHEPGSSSLEVVYGKNSFGKPLISETLRETFKKCHIVETL